MLGGKGRPVIGRVQRPLGWTKPVDFNDRSEAHIESNRPSTPYPLSLFRGKTMADQGERWSEWQQRWHQSPEGHDYRESPRVRSPWLLAPDGSFRIDVMQCHRESTGWLSESTESPTFHVAVMEKGETLDHSRISSGTSVSHPSQEDGAMSRSDLGRAAATTAAHAPSRRGGTGV